MTPEPGPSGLDGALGLLLDVPPEPGWPDLVGVFGPAPGITGYRRLARLVHPDRVPAARSGAATAAFVRLGDLWLRYQSLQPSQVTGRGAAGRAASAASADPTTDSADVEPGDVEPGDIEETVIRTGRHLHTIRVVPRRTAVAKAAGAAGGRPDGGVIEGDVALLYPAECRETASGTRRTGLLKVPRSAADNDLMEREAAALTRLARAGDRRFAAYAPRLVESFLHTPATGGGQCSAPRRRVNVLERLDGFQPLTRVHAAYPQGVDPRDAAWMWRRLLVALGYAHRAGVLHGAVVPDHVLIHPEKHGLVLVDWCYSVIREPDTAPAVGPAAGSVAGSAAGPDNGPAAGTADAAARVPAVVPRFAPMYPPEVAARRRPDEATDIYLATRCMTYLIGPGLPARLRAFARGCTLPAVARRPHDAWRLLTELDDVLERLYGPRRFRPFHLPAADG
ncbi:hypothetical protein [Parafrankia sp. EUN1f]|uniref:hypothetical protein n=1 Tax=Parafrankia sp. EUN1f TaxID=102897 RepID=UPI0001C4718E|nr:hypothetical protein [Parafrankia sp. EUN1f]EFC79583.1 hypothetical protein FrEUN1fDRAFT_7306 [Parafrankia sp. EUN1f]